MKTSVSSFSPADMNTPPIDVENLTKHYGDHEAVRGISFSVKRGEIYGLLGPNGAGKTTTVEILEGYRSRSGGQVSVLGYDPGKRPTELRQKIGIVLQNCGFYNHLTVKEAIEYWAGLYPHPRNVLEVMTLVGLGDLGSQKTRTLSGGQSRRLDLALALISDPDLIFLDEPTTGFDPEARRAAWKTIAALRDLGKTVVLTTHYLDEAQELADRVAIIKNGQIVTEGPPNNLIKDSGYQVSYRIGDSNELHREQTMDPTSLLNRLTTDALANSTTLNDLSVTRPTLEDVYLRLISDDRYPAEAEADLALSGSIEARKVDKGLVRSTDTVECETGEDSAKSDKETLNAAN